MILGQAPSPPFFLASLDFSPPRISDRSAIPVYVCLIAFLICLLMYLLSVQFTLFFIYSIGVKDISCKNETVFVVNRDGQVLGFEFLSVKTCLKCLIGLPEYRQAAEVCFSFLSASFVFVSLLALPSGIIVYKNMGFVL